MQVIISDDLAGQFTNRIITRISRGMHAGNSLNILFSSLPQIAEMKVRFAKENLFQVLPISITMFQYLIQLFMVSAPLLSIEKEVECRKRYHCQYPEQSTLSSISNYYDIKIWDEVRTFFTDNRAPHKCTEQKWERHFQTEICFDISSEKSLLQILINRSRRGLFT